MDYFDKDILSIQHTRELLKRAKQAQSVLAGFNQHKIDTIAEAMAEAGCKNAALLAEMAVKETGIGVAADKTVKNEFASKGVWNYIRDMRTAGVINEDKARGMIEIAEPMGVVAGIIPTTNPTSTIIFKCIIALKARCGIVMSPHPRAIECSKETARIMEEAAVSAGAPKGIISCIEISTREATEELMKSPLTSVILSTGGSALVKASYSSGKPAFGVGPGNVPAFIERTANIDKAVSDIIASKTFDNGTICASEQAVITERVISDQVIDAFKSKGCCFLSPEDTYHIEKTVMLQGGGVNPEVVGRSAKEIAEMAGIQVPDGTRILIARLFGVGKPYPLSAEKLCPVLAFYIEEDWQSACERCIELLRFGGLGHSLSIHSNDREIIMEFAMKKPVFRILVNTPSSQGGIGQTTHLQPSLTLGCGTWGGNVTADNVGPQHLINIKRLAFSKELSQGYHYTREEIEKALDRYLSVV
jgi:acetaldehyde dehydrogenase (acetylating)